MDGPLNEKDRRIVEIERKAAETAYHSSITQIDSVKMTAIY